MDISDELNERIRFKNLAIDGLVKEYRGTKMNFISETDIRKIFNYLERYCEIISHGQVPIRIYKSSDKCSVFWMKGKLMMFFLNYGRVYKGMTPLQIIEKILGREEYESVLNTYFSEPNDEDFTEPIDKMTEVKGTMEEVDGGARKKRKRMRKTKRRGSKRKNKRRKSSKR
jgi:hypothetical protein